MFSERDYQRYRSPPWGRRPQDGASIVMALIIANAAIFVVQLLTGTRINPLGIGEILALDTATLQEFKIWGIGTYMFSHGSFWHILVNMYGLYIFGKPLEERLDGNSFLSVYFFSGIIGGLLWLFVNWGTNNVLVGASGALFGIMMAAAMITPNRQYMLLLVPVPIRLKTLAAIFAGIEILSHLGSTGEGANVAHLAHLGGLAGGFIYVRFFYRGRRPGRTSGSYNPFYAVKSMWSKLMGRIRQSRFSFVDHEGEKKEETKDSGSEEESSDNIDDVLDKIGRKGVSSLTKEERERLEKARKKLREKR